MISFNNLGNLGRLGNQMFQYASLKGIAHNCGHDYCIPPREVFGHNDLLVKKSESIIYDVFDLEKNNNVKILSNQMIFENGFNFNENIFNDCPDDVDVYGYFQTEKYFQHIKDEVKKDFTFKKDLMDECQEFFNSAFGEQEIISLHIRRGDYTINSNHPVQPIDYYEKSLTKLPDNIPVLVFSDDPEWCQKQEIFEPERFYVSENNTTEFDLCFMAFASYHIIANSSFSWWGAWLSDSKKVIAPKNWFGGDCINHNTKDLYCKNWILL
jgi:hypothetical protein